MIGINILIGVLGFVVGCMSKNVNIVTLSDVLKQKEVYRTETQRLNDAVMQLKNEIVNSKTVHLKELENGDTEVSLKVVL